MTECGPRIYSISPLGFAFLTLSGDTLMLESSNLADFTAVPETITITATLVNYSNVAAATASFTIEIADKCRTSTLSFAPVVTNMEATVNLGPTT